MPASLTTHVLDTACGRPAAGIGITLYRLDGSQRTECARAVTNADGRTDTPVLPAAETGVYELVFHASEYLRAIGQTADPLFLSEIPIRFGIAEERHYHVPLLLSPFGYATYRGS